MKYNKLLESDRKLKYFQLVNYYCATIIKGTFKMEINSRNGWVCWGRLVHELSHYILYDRIEVKIKIITDPAFCFAYNKKHYCFFQKKEIESYLDMVSTNYGPFEYTLKDGKFANFKCYDLKLDFSTINRKKLLWILNLVRHLYEFPFNVMLLDALNLSKLPQFKKQHLTNLLQLVATVATGVASTDHTFKHKEIYCQNQSLGSIWRKLVRLSTIRKELASLDVIDISSIYKNKIFSAEYTSMCKNLLLPFEVVIDKVTYPIESFGYWFKSNDWSKDRQKRYIDFYNTYLKISRKKD